MTPQTINAYYNPSSSTRSSSRPPSCSRRSSIPSADDAVNYGAIGAVIGHEISHGFDDQGAQYDGDGNLRDWWTDGRPREVRGEDRRCWSQQYDAFEPVPGYHVNGELTLGENIADNSRPGDRLQGVPAVARRQAGAGHRRLDRRPALLHGLRAGVAQQDARRLADAELVKSDPHSPGRFRVNGTVRNQPAFYPAFGVKPGDKMYLSPGAARHHLVAAPSPDDTAATIGRAANGSAAAPVPSPDPIHSRAALAERFGPSYRWRVLATVMIGTVASIMASTIINVAVPDMAKVFGLGQDRAQWLSAGFMGAMTLSMLTTPWLLARYGYRHTYFGAVLLLMAGGIVGGLSRWFELVLAMRVAEGLAAGILQPIPAIVIMHAFGPGERGKAMGIFGFGVVLAPAVGPSIGGVLVEWFGWRSIFFVVTPFASSRSRWRSATCRSARPAARRSAAKAAASTSSASA